MTIKNYIFIFIAFIGVLFLGACNDLPTNIGYPLDTLYLEAISSSTLPLVSSTKTYYNRLDGNWPNPIMLVGKAKDVESYSFLRFGTTKIDTFQYVQESEIISSKLRLYPNRYSFGDSLTTGAADFGLYETIKAMGDSTTFDTIIAKGGISAYFNPTELGSFTGKIDLKDTIPPIIIELNSQKIIKKWLDMAKDVTSAEALYKNGITLAPRSNSKVINRFASNFDSSRFEVVFNNSKKGRIDTIHISLQTVSNYSNTTIDLNDSSMYLQYGVSLRGLLSFDLSMIPKYASVISSELEITFDSTRSYYANYGTDTTFSAGDFTNIYIKKPITPYLALRKAGTDKYIFPSITSAIERWVRKDGKGTIQLIPQRNTSAATEYIYLDRSVFFGQDAKDIDKRPKLKVIYSRRPKN